jgi:hypothetical protein
MLCSTSWKGFSQSQYLQPGPPSYILAFQVTRIDQPCSEERQEMAGWRLSASLRGEGSIGGAGVKVWSVVDRTFIKWYRRLMLTLLREHGTIGSHNSSAKNKCFKHRIPQGVYV